MFFMYYIAMGLIFDLALEPFFRAAGKRRTVMTLFMCLLFWPVFLCTGTWVYLRMKKRP